MKKDLKRFLKGRFTASTNLLSIFNSVLRKPFSKHQGDDAVDYAHVSVDMNDMNSICDRATAFYLRVILQYRHETVLEIGTFTGERILAVKRCLPQITAFGLDIGPKFKKEFETGGVQFSEFSLEFFKKPLPKPLVVCHCTLNYFKPEDLRTFLKTLRENNYPIAFCEPVPHFAFDETLSRSHIAYYHPYEKVFSECGFHLVETNPQNASWHSFSTSMGEFTYMNYAFPGANSPL